MERLEHEPTWQAPGPGRWELDRSHYPGGTTPIAIWLMEQAMPAGMRRTFAALGVPVETLECRFVNGFMYTRLRPLIGGSRSATRPPPRFVLSAVARLHPAFRRARRQLIDTLETRPWRAVVAEWHSTTRPALEAANLAFEDIDPRSLDDSALARRLEALLESCQRNFELHFWLHGFDLGPIGLLLAECRRWGIDAHEVLPALQGASPSTAAPARALGSIRGAVIASGARPGSLEELRGVSGEVADALDHYLRYRGSVLFSRYYLDGVTLREVPDVVLSTVMDGIERTPDDGSAAIATALRQRVPEAERAVFDGWLSEARAAMDLRDDNGPNTVAWPSGLLRGSMLELGRRMAARGDLQHVDHVFELRHDELTDASTRPDQARMADLRDRATRRRALASLVPPLALGPEEPLPPLDVLPAPMASIVEAVNLVVSLMGMARSQDVARHPLSGSGIGSTTYRGRARRADSAEEAIMAMEVGDVLVVPFTTPAYNVVLGIAGAVVTSEGGPMCHAAVLARELGIPAVIGAAGALDITDGALIEVDPVAGRVTVIDRALTEL